MTKKKGKRKGKNNPMWVKMQEVWGTVEGQLQRAYTGRKRKRVRREDASSSSEEDDAVEVAQAIDDMVGRVDVSPPRARAKKTEGSPTMATSRAARRFGR
eukprot:gene6962-9101_t